jgi:hypothetical protein
MANTNKTAKATKEYSKKMEELDAIEECPQLTEYIFRSKIKDVKKTGIIIVMMVAIAAFFVGLFIGINITSTAVPNNTIEVKVEQPQPTVQEETEQE